MYELLKFPLMSNLFGPKHSRIFIYVVDTSKDANQELQQRVYPREIRTLNSDPNDV